MIPFYWMEGLQEYDREMFKNGLLKHLNRFSQIGNEYGFQIEPINIAHLFFGYHHRPQVLYKGEDILSKEACAYIPYTNPHAQTERLFHSLSRIVGMSKTWTQINAPFQLDRDKEYIYHLASLIGVSTIPSWIVPERTTSRMQVDLIEKQVGPYPYLIKPTSMLAGMGIIKIDTRDALCSLLDYCAQSPQIYMIQPFMKDVADYRVYLENHEVIACQKRTPPKEGYLSNISQRGSGQSTSIDPRIEKPSIQLARHLTKSYLCIDWLVSEEKAYLSEIDFCGMFFGLSESDRTNVMHAFFRSAQNKFREQVRGDEGIPHNPLLPFFLEG